MVAKKLKKLAWITLFFACANIAGVFSDNQSVILLYPEIEEPYKAIFDEIIQGINKEIRSPVNAFVIAKNKENPSIETWVQQKNSRAIIALGQRGLKAAQSLKTPIPLVIGAIINLDEKPAAPAVAISYAPDPKLVFTILKKLSPEITTVNVVYNPLEMGWFIDIAKKAADEQKITINTFEADDFKQSAQLYKSILEKMHSKTEALWLLQDNTILDDRVLLPYILEQSWKKNLIIFSNNLSHVAKGILFSLYPDNYNLGIRLANIANSMSSTDSKIELLPLQDVRYALNIRTAKHLDLKVSYQLQREFTLIFPQR